MARDEVSCKTCGGARWVCEDHLERPWGGASDRSDACHCGGAGAPCPACNPCDRDNPPQMPEGYLSLVTRDTRGLSDEDGPIRAFPPPRCRGIPIGDGNYTGCAYGDGDLPPFTGPQDCPTCNGSGIEGYG